MARRAVQAVVARAAFAAAAMAIGSSAAQSSPAQPPARSGPAWSLALSKGEVLVYHRTVAFSGRDSATARDIRFAVRTTERSEIRDVNARGDLTIVTACTSAEIDRDGTTQRIETTAYPATTRVLSKTGLVLREADAGETAGDPLLVVQTLLANQPAPPAAVRPNSVWRADLVNRLAPARPVALNSRLLGISRSAGAQTAHVAVSADVPTAPRAASEPIRISGERWIDMATGRLVKARVRIDNTPFTVGGAAGSVTLTEELVPAAAAEAPAGRPPGTGRP